MGDVVHLTWGTDVDGPELDEVERLIVKLLRTIDPDRVHAVLAAAGHRPARSPHPSAARPAPPTSAAAPTFPRPLTGRSRG